MLSFAYGWYDLEAQKVGQVGVVSLRQDRSYHAGSDNDFYVVRRLFELFDQAEVLVGQNHERFDIKKANERFLVHGFKPPSPYATIDTKRIWNQNFSGSASLKYMARKADVALKADSGGFATWLGCMNNERAAWEKMETYNIADVIATSEVFTKILPWADMKYSRSVNFGHYRPGKFACPRCMNTEDEEGFQKRGWHGTGASRFQTYLCKRCGHWPRDYRRIPQRHDTDKTYLR